MRGIAVKLDKRKGMIVLSLMTEDEQKGFLRRFCDENPLKQYILNLPRFTARTPTLRSVFFSLGPQAT
jgi:hypothetical protein